MCCGWDHPSWIIIMKVFNCFAGASLIVLGILRFVFVMQLSGFLQYILTLYYMYKYNYKYHRLFGVLIILSEVNIEKILYLFSFQQSYIGRGLLFIL